MKILDVVNQLRILLPRYTDKFSNVLTISSIVAASGVATIQTTSAHGLTTGQSITLANVLSKNPLSTVSQSGLLFTFTTATAHDLTLGWEEHETVTFDGFTDSAWNDSFRLIAVPNRNKFTVQSTNTIPSLTGSEVLFENRVDGVNGQYSVTVVDTTTFTVSGDFLDGTYTGGIVSNTRVAGSVNIERSLEQYTEQGESALWLFVSMDPAETSKDRATLSDATSTKTSGSDMRLRLLDGFTLFAIKNVSQDIAAVEALDICRHDVLLPILKSVYGAVFESGLSGSGDFRAVLTGHGTEDYDHAVYVHSYSFQMAMDLTDSDAVDPTNTRAFRDLDYTHSIGGEDTTDMTVEIDLDETPFVNQLAFNNNENSQYIPLL